MNWIKIKIVTLPTKDETNIGVNLNGKLIYIPTGLIVKTPIKYQHLYFTSDDKIKEGDKMIGVVLGNYGVILDCPENTLITENTVWRKIIATTDTKLTKKDDWFNFMNRAKKSGLSPLLLEQKEKGINISLPQPSQSFIKEYCDKGGIDEVEIEYEFIHADRAPGGFERFIKVNESNEINIKSIKDSWTREEHIYGIKKLRDFLFSNIDLDNLAIDIYKETDKWIKENL